MTSRFPFTSFPVGWFRVATGSDLPIGKVQTLRYFGRDLVLFRPEDGKASVLDAHCPHVGAHLGHGGKVFGNTIQCPFHGWRLAGDGTCVNIPYSEKIPASARTRSWPVDEVNGQIMVYHDPSGAAPAWRVPEFPEYRDDSWTPFGPGHHWVIRTHVQELCENGMDSAHFSFLHSQQTQKMRTEALEIDGPRLTHRTFQYYNIFGPAKFFVSEVTGPLDVSFYGLGCAVNRTCVDARLKLFYTFAFYFTPVDEEHSEVSSMLAMRKMSFPFANKLLIKKAVREGKRTIDQDVPIWENKVYRDRPGLCEGDGPIMQYRRWAAQFYAVS
jgi:phenylpropionate dioxygenase-like ring-hydroxylating dioxygenase large terminal subunit